MSDALVPATNSGAIEPDAHVLHVVFRVADADYALPADEVLQMETYTGATVVPGAQSFVAGIIQLRGRVIPVVDLRLRFGLPKGEITLDSRVVVAEHAGRTVALIADSAREVVRIPRSAIKPPPKLAELGARGFVRHVAQLDARMILILDFAKVIGEETIDV